MNSVPPISVIMPILNEERHLENSVARVMNQDYPGEIELILALGPSRDRTTEIATELAKKFPNIKLIDSPTGKTPNALNMAIRNASHSIIARLDGHALIDPQYLKIAVQTLSETQADNVGGVMNAQGTTNFERAVAKAMTSKFGVGNAPFHVGGKAGEALTVYLGVFKKEIFSKVGLFNEEFVRAQDWEMNHRIRTQGGKIWFNPQLQVTYRPRSTLTALAKQYFQYGQGRRKITKTHKGTLSLRYLTPPVAVLAMAIGLLMALFGVASGNSILLSGLIAPAIYLAAVLAASGFLARGLGIKTLLYLPIVFICMHICWGVGFLKPA